MRIAKPALVAALTAAGLLAWSGAATAGALYTVTAWHDVNVRTCPSTACGVVGGLVAGQQRKVECWVRGEPVADAGVTNDVWLQVDDADENGPALWSSAVYFVGDEYAGLPADALCADFPAR